MRAVSPMAFVLAVSLLPIVEAQARVDMFARLRNLKSKGFNPDSIVDVGANQGDWTTRTSRIWPKARMFMVEGTPDKEARLKSIGHPFEITLLGDATKTVPMNIDNRQGTGGTGNGIFRESAAPAGGFRLVDRKMTTLDELLASRGHPAPQLLKLDVQGAELLVLQGARRTLESVEAILVEMSIVEWNVGAPFFFEVRRAVASAALRPASTPSYGRCTRRWSSSATRRTIWSSCGTEASARSCSSWTSSSSRRVARVAGWRADCCSLV